MAQRLIRIDLKNYNCRGIYLEDSVGLFGVDVIEDDKLANKVKPPFKLILRTTVLKNEKKITSKKTFPFNDSSVTLKRAIEKVNAQREDFRNQIIIPPSIEPKVDTKAQEEKEAKLNTKLCDYWIEYCAYKKSTLRAKESWRESTARGMESYYSKWIKPSKLNDMRVRDIQTEDVEELIGYVKSCKKSLRTAKTVTEALSPLFKRFYAQNKINEINPAAIDIGDLNNVRDVHVTIEEAKRLYDAMLNYPVPKYRNIFIWLATGRRLNEVLSLKLNDINLEKMMFDIHQDNSKSGKKLTFVLRPEMLESLEHKVELIHPSEKNTKMDGATIRKHWSKVLATAKLKDLHIHDLRHIIATELRNSGVTEEVSALVLGHTRTSITARYASQNAQLANEVYQFFLDKIDGKIEPTAKWVEV